MGKRMFTRLQLKDKMLLLALVSIILSGGGVDGKDQGRKNSLEVDKKLKFLSRPAVKSIQSEDGDIIDCVDIYKQPAFDHPALKNHTIQMRPNYHPGMETDSGKNESAKTVVVQTWQRSGSCPIGTIPIRRIRRQDLLRAASLERFGMKNPQASSTANKTVDQGSHVASMNENQMDVGPQINRSAAILYTYGFDFIAAAGEINVWNPNVESQDEHTTAQIWVKHGPLDAFESLESGWAVNPTLYGDKLTRIFVHWTVDAYKKTGCFDLTCSGFVQTTPQLVLGGSISSVSVKNGPQYIISVQIYQEPKTGNWWLQVGNIVVGYWPLAILTKLKQSSTLVEWGGEVYSSKKTTPHTGTAMGSGEPASGLFGVACFIAKIRIMDYSLQLKYPMLVPTWADDSNCYSAINHRDGDLSEPMLYFGGPGRNPGCP